MISIYQSKMLKKLYRELLFLGLRNNVYGSEYQALRISGDENSSVLAYLGRWIIT